MKPSTRIFLVLFCPLAVSALPRAHTTTHRAVYASEPTPDPYTFPTINPEPAPSSECSTDSLQCCNSLEHSSSPSVSSILDALNLNLDVAQYVGLKCTPLDAVALGGKQACSAMPLCCNGNTFGGLSLGCSPVNFL